MASPEAALGEKGRSRVLKYLNIENFAIADKVEIEFDGKFNVITGETGAGKTIIVNAFSLLIGDRADREIIRKGTKKAKIEAIFKVPNKVLSILKENSIDTNNREIELKRIIRRNKNNKVYLNGNRVTLTLVREIMENLVDLNNQNENQYLMNTENHIYYIDHYGDYQDLKDKYQKNYRRLKHMIEKYTEYRDNKKKLMRRLDNLKYEYKEIEGVDPEVGEDENLREELNMLENAKDIMQSGNFIYNIADEDEMFSEILDKIYENLKNIKGVNKQLTEYSDEIEAGLQKFISASEDLKFYIDDMELDEERLNKANDRLDEIEKLKNKYGDSIEDVLEYKKEIENEIEEIEEMTFDFENMHEKIENLKEKVVKLAEKLHEKRADAADEFSKSIKKELSFLGMRNSSFRVNFEDLKEGLNIEERFYNSDGKYRVRFFIETNTGEGFYPLTSIVSGGELSRILFSIKSVISDKFDVDLLIFDEIDSGIGGEISKKMAKKLKTLSNRFQLIVITHQPQIAAVSNKHFRVEKQKVSNRTVSRVKTLSNNQHVEEIARMIAGENINDHIIETAKSMCYEEE
ncbi:MAG: DNA repair protein RecN [Candidatus Mcinerneyibacterium aminivorans]|uniref:DNA repair protein RecN n=1 Tax=Candidatus Mcinerneyibacterium aminivorans TaxID=2703815 RepID=A0A5D0MCV0_9BACT|nr:MAG: DNA repair protein RecN [Candidatus Mcinerneyibacterium aminivorans]